MSYGICAYLYYTIYAHYYYLSFVLLKKQPFGCIINLRTQFHTISVTHLSALATRQLDVFTVTNAKLQIPI